MSQRGDVQWKCSECDEQIIVNVNDIEKAMTSLVSVGRYEQYDARSAHRCKSGWYGIATVVRGVPTPPPEIGARDERI